MKATIMLAFLSGLLMHSTTEAIHVGPSVKQDAILDRILRGRRGGRSGKSSSSSPRSSSGKTSSSSMSTSSSKSSRGMISSSSKSDSRSRRPRRRPEPVLIEGVVSLDTDWDGDGEDPMPGIVVELKDEDGNVVATSATDADGFYSFEVPPGVYTLEDMEDSSLHKDADVGVSTVDTTDGEDEVVNFINVPVGCPTVPVPLACGAFISEFHYDTDSTDAGEFIEVAYPAGSDISLWTLHFYEGEGASAGTVDDVENLSDGTVGIRSPGDALGFVALDISGIENGPDGVALVDEEGCVLDFISWEAEITATEGPADGMTSMQVPGADGPIAAGTSISRQGTGCCYEDFGTWAAAVAETKSAVNTGMTLSCPAEPFCTNDKEAPVVDSQCTDEFPVCAGDAGSIGPGATGTQCVECTKDTSEDLSICITLDESTSITDDEWTNFLSVLSDVVNELAENEAATLEVTIGGWSGDGADEPPYDGEEHETVPWTTDLTSMDAQLAADSGPQGGFTQMEAGFRWCREQLESATLTDANQVVFLMTDGAPNRPCAPVGERETGDQCGTPQTRTATLAMLAEAQLLKDAGVTVAALGIGTTVDSAAMAQATSNPGLYLEEAGGFDAITGAAFDSFVAAIVESIASFASCSD